MLYKLIASLSLALLLARCEDTRDDLIIESVNEALEKEQNSQTHEFNDEDLQDSTPGNYTPEIPEETVSEEEQERINLLMSMPADISISDWNLLLVNNNQPLPEDFEVDLTEVEPEKQIDSRIEQAYREWMNAARDAGHQLFFASGYRSVERQTNNYNSQINSFMNEGYSEEEAILRTQEYIAIPNHSEHHTGLALDIIDQQWIAQGKGLVPEYDTQESQHWMMDTKEEYGFILRYPEGKEDITGIQYESWHFRYVGVDNAVFIKEHELVLEEYIYMIQERNQLIESD